MRPLLRDEYRLPTCLEILVQALVVGLLVLLAALLLNLLVRWIRWGGPIL